MKKLSTRAAAKRLGLSPVSLSRYIAAGKVPSPEIVKMEGSSIHLWTEAAIERVREMLPKLKNGRKNRYKRKQQKAE